jgi:tRNA A37 methylthiotransferase MiaB
VQNGCDHRCTFCIIPFGRGNSRSVPAATVVEQIARLVGRGFNEVVLTGVDLTHPRSPTAAKTWEALYLTARAEARWHLPQYAVEEVAQDVLIALVPGIDDLRLRIDNLHAYIRVVALHACRTVAF